MIAMSETQHSWSYKKKGMTPSQHRKMTRDLLASYKIWDKIRNISEINRQAEQEQAEEELTTRLSII